MSPQQTLTALRAKSSSPSRLRSPGLGGSRRWCFRWRAASCCLRWWWPLRIGSGSHRSRPSWTSACRTLGACRVRRVRCVLRKIGLSAAICGQGREGRMARGGRVMRCYMCCGTCTRRMCLWYLEHDKWWILAVGKPRWVARWHCMECLCWDRKVDDATMLLSTDWPDMETLMRAYYRMVEGRYQNMDEEQACDDVDDEE